MGLINVDDPLPGHMWATVRLLLSSKDRSVPAAVAQAYLAPPSLGDKAPQLFRKTSRLLTEFGLIDGTADLLRIADGEMDDVHTDDVTSFTHCLRRALFADTQNIELTTLVGEVKQTGTLDLNRALCWFLSFDPYQGYELEREMGRAAKALRPEAGTKAITNVYRLPHFKSWAQFLGLARPAIFSGQKTTDDDFQVRMAPDCTAAVRSVLRTSEQITKGVPIPASVLLSILRNAIPVIPGGRHSIAVGIAPPEPDYAGELLSYALLRGEDEKWLVLDRHSDAQHRIRVLDPDSPRSFKSVTQIMFVE